MPVHTQGLQSWIERLNQSELPALASVVTDLQRLTQAEHASVQQLADVLLRDAALTSKVLRVANSSYYNPSQEVIKTISRAIVLIGFDNVRLISLSVSLVDGLLDRAPRHQLLELLALPLGLARLPCTQSAACDAEVCELLAPGTRSQQLRSSAP